MQKTYQSTLQVETKPKDVLEDARNLIKRAEYENAYDLIEDDSSLEALMLKSDILVSLKDYQKALECIDDAISISDSDDLQKVKAEVLYRWAKVTYFPEANFYRALDLIEKALEIVPDGDESLEYWFLKGEILQSLENHIDARRCFLKAEQRLDELQILEDELNIFEVHKNDVLINITGISFYKGMEVFEEGTVLKLERDNENEHDPDAIACYIGDEIVGYVANSKYTLINDVKGASDIRGMLSDNTTAEVILIFQNEFVIAKVNI